MQVITHNIIYPNFLHFGKFYQISNIILGRMLPNVTKFVTSKLTIVIALQLQHRIEQEINKKLYEINKKYNY